MGRLAERQLVEALELHGEHLKLLDIKIEGRPLAKDAYSVLDDKLVIKGGAYAGKALDNGSTRAPVVKVGDKVLFGKYAGTEVKLDGTEYLVVREDDIFAIL